MIDDTGGIKRQIVLLEPNFAGHRMNYVRIIRDYCAAHDLDCTLATSSQTLRSSEFNLRFGGQNPSIKTIDLGDLPDVGRPGYQSWVVRSIRHLMVQYIGSTIAVLEGDKLLPRLLCSGLIGTRRLTVLMMRVPTRFGKAPLGPAQISKRIFARVLSASGISIVGLAPAQAVASRYKYQGFRAAPDPVSLDASAMEVSSYRLRFGIDENVYWFGIFGNIHARKNVDMVADALASLEGTARVGLLLAGQISEAEMMRIQPAIQRLRSRGAVVLDNRLLSDLELDAAVSSVAAVVVAHSTEGPSGILGKGAAAGKFLLVAGPESLKDDVQRLRGRGTFVPLREEGIRRGLAQAMSTHPGIAMPEAPAPAGGAEFAKALLGLR